MFSRIINDMQSNRDKDPIVLANEILGIIQYKDSAEPVPIVKIAKNMGFSVNVMEKLPNDDSGVIIISPGLNDILGSAKCVFIKKDMKYGKQRFVTAHELGHFLYEYNVNDTSFSHSFVRSYNKDAADNEKERIVNEFASNLLMPKEIFKKEFKKMSKNSVTVDIVVQLSELFATTTKSVERRVDELGLVKASGQ